NPLEGVEVLDFARNATVETGGVEISDGCNATDSGEKILPAFLRADSQRADQSNACNHNPASQSLPHPIFDARNLKSHGRSRNSAPARCASALFFTETRAEIFRPGQNLRITLFCRRS